MIQNIFTIFFFVFRFIFNLLVLYITYRTCFLLEILFFPIGGILKTINVKNSLPPVKTSISQKTNSVLYPFYRLRTDKNA